MLYYLAKSEPFPRRFEVADRFAGRQKDVTDTLYPMLLAGEEPRLDAMIESAHAFLLCASSPVDADEAEYLDRYSVADFAPELLFADYPGTLTAAGADPTVAWKLQNLAKTLSR